MEDSDLKNAGCNTAIGRMKKTQLKHSGWIYTLFVLLACLIVFFIIMGELYWASIFFIGFVIGFFSLLHHVNKGWKKDYINDYGAAISACVKHNHETSKYKLRTEELEGELEEEKSEVLKLSDDVKDLEEQLLKSLEKQLEMMNKEDVGHLVLEKKPNKSWARKIIKIAKKDLVRLPKRRKKSIHDFKYIWDDVKNPKEAKEPKIPLKVESKVKLKTKPLIRMEREILTAIKTDRKTPSIILEKVKRKEWEDFKEEIRESPIWDDYEEYKVRPNDFIEKYCKPYDLFGSGDLSQAMKELNDDVKGIIRKRKWSKIFLKN